MKELSFKDLPIKLPNQSSLYNSKVNLDNSSTTHTNPTQLKIQSIRKKYDSPSFCKSVRQSALLDSPLVDVTNLNQSHLTNKEYLKNTQNISNRCYYGTQEEVVLQKIKMMKESLLNDKNKGIVGRLKTEQDKTTQILKNYQVKGDSRADNIDRINSKIKHILNCLNQNQKENRKIEKLDKSYYQVKSKDSYEALRRSCQDTKNYDNKKLKQKASQAQQKYNQYQISLQINKQSKNNQNNDIKQLKFQPEKQQMKKQDNRYLQKNQNQQNINVARSKSNYCLHKRTHCQSIERDLKNSKKFDQQIEKIQLKIKKFEEQKRKLNIQFKPFQYQKPIKNSIDKNKLSPAYRLSEITKNSDKTTEIQHPITPFIKNNIQLPNNQQLILQKEKRKYQIQNIIQKKHYQYKQYINSQDTYKKQLQDKQFRKKMNDGIQQRKKKLTNHNPSFNIYEKNSTVKLLVKILTQQVQKDQQLRNAKIWFSNNSDLNKFNKIKEELGKLNIILDLNQIKLQFQITDEQNNPFFSIRQSRQTYQSLAKKYSIAYQYWNSNLLQKFKKADLQRNNFTVNKIDLERKGYIVLEDLVRLLNMQTGKFFRNRDLILIFRRFTKSNQMIFQDFLKVITQLQ